LKALELQAAYQNTRYFIEDLHTFLCIGSINPTVDAWLQEKGLAHVVFITAFNPLSQIQEQDYNLKHSILLESEIKDRIYFKGYGEGMDGDWPKEHGFFVGDLPEHTTFHLMDKYGQFAVVWHEWRKVSILRWNKNFSHLALKNS